MHLLVVDGQVLVEEPLVEGVQVVLLGALHLQEEVVEGLRASQQLSGQTLYVLLVLLIDLPGLLFEFVLVRPLY